MKLNPLIVILLSNQINHLSGLDCLTHECNTGMTDSIYCSYTIKQVEAPLSVVYYKRAVYLDEPYYAHVKYQSNAFSIELCESLEEALDGKYGVNNLAYGRYEDYYWAYEKERGFFEADNVGHEGFNSLTNALVRSIFRNSKEFQKIFLLLIPNEVTTAFYDQDQLRQLSFLHGKDSHSIIYTENEPEIINGYKNIHLIAQNRTNKVEKYQHRRRYKTGIDPDVNYIPAEIFAESRNANGQWNEVEYVKLISFNALTIDFRKEDVIPEPDKYYYQKRNIYSNDVRYIKIGTDLIKPNTLPPQDKPNIRNVVIFTFSILTITVLILYKQRVK